MPTWAAFFDNLSDAPDDVSSQRARAELAAPRLAARVNGDLVSALDGNWGEVAVKTQKAVSDKAKAAEGVAVTAEADACRRRAIPSTPS